MLGILVAYTFIGAELTSFALGRTAAHTPVKAKAVALAFARIKGPFQAPDAPAPACSPKARQHMQRCVRLLISKRALAQRRADKQRSCQRLSDELLLAAYIGTGQAATSLLRRMQIRSMS